MQLSELEKIRWDALQRPAGFFASFPSKAGVQARRRAPMPKVSYRPVAGLSLGSGQHKQGRECKSACDANDLVLISVAPLKCFLGSCAGVSDVSRTLACRWVSTLRIFPSGLHGAVLHPGDRLLESLVPRSPPWQVVTKHQVREKHPQRPIESGLARIPRSSWRLFGRTFVFPVRTTHCSPVSRFAWSFFPYTTSMGASCAPKGAPTSAPPPPNSLLR